MKLFLEQWNPTVKAAFVPGMRITSLFQQRKQKPRPGRRGAERQWNSSGKKSRTHSRQTFHRW